MREAQACIVLVSAAQAPVYDLAITGLNEGDEKTRGLARQQAKREAILQLGLDCLHEVAQQTFCLKRARICVISEQLAEDMPGS